MLLLDARRRFSRADFVGAANALEDASARLEEALYREPPVWYYDPRDCLGYVRLVGLGDAEGALAAHEASLLKWNGRSPWALLGKADALKALGREEEAEDARAGYAQHWKGKVPLDSSCLQYSRVEIPAGGGAVEGLGPHIVGPPRAIEKRFGEPQALGSRASLALETARTQQQSAVVFSACFGAGLGALTLCLAVAYRISKWRATAVRLALRRCGS